MKNIFILGLALIGFAGTARAERQFGDAGCGLGSMVMGKDGNQVSAATTNNTAWNNLFAISFGTSNCVEDGHVVSRRALDNYVEVNQVALSSDVSRGTGDTVEGLASLMGCRDSVLLGRSMQKSYTDLFPSQTANPRDVSASIRGLVKSNPELRAACTTI